MRVTDDLGIIGIAVGTLSITHNRQINLVIQEIIRNHTRHFTIIAEYTLLQVSVLFRHWILFHPRIKDAEVFIHVGNRFLADRTGVTSLHFIITMGIPRYKDNRHNNQSE